MRDLSPKGLRGGSRAAAQAHGCLGREGLGLVVERNAKGSDTYIHIHIYTYIHVHVNIHIHIYIYTYIHFDGYLHTYIHTYIHTYLDTHYNMYIWMHLYTYIYIHIYMYMCRCIRMYHRATRVFIVTTFSSEACFPPEFCHSRSKVCLPVRAVRPVCRAKQKLSASKRAAADGSRHLESH